MSLTSYLDYANAQNKVIDTVKGIIIYPDTSGIPQEVLFIPTTEPLGGSFNTYLSDFLSKRSPLAYTVYFQGIRWIVPDIADTLSSLIYIKGSLNQYIIGGIKEVRISYGGFVFDKREIPALDKTPKPVLLSVNGKSYSLSYLDFNNELGIPKAFEKISFWSISAL